MILHVPTCNVLATNVNTLAASALRGCSDRVMGGIGYLRIHWRLRLNVGSGSFGSLVLNKINDCTTVLTYPIKRTIGFSVKPYIYTLNFV
jgi:hypothetical protein